MFIELHDIHKSYGNEDVKIPVLNGVTTSVEKGQIVVILGASGSGKSTLLNVVGGLDNIETGKISVDGLNVSGLNNEGLEKYRRDYLGFIFQFYNLIPNLNVEENIKVCRYLSKTPMDIDELIETLGLNEHRKKMPSQLSGGQQQRCAIARALVKNPKILLCDEPTGALDSKMAKEIMVLLETVNEKYGTTMLIVTHNNAMKEMADKVICIKDGIIIDDYENQERKKVAEIEW